MHSVHFSSIVVMLVSERRLKTSLFEYRVTSLYVTECGLNQIK